MPIRVMCWCGKEFGWGCFGGQRVGEECVGLSGGVEGADGGHFTLGARTSAARCWVTLLISWSSIAPAQWTTSWASGSALTSSHLLTSHSTTLAPIQTNSSTRPGRGGWRPTRSTLEARRSSSSHRPTDKPNPRCEFEGVMGRGESGGRRKGSGGRERGRWGRLRERGWGVEGRREVGGRMEEIVKGS